VHGIHAVTSKVENSCQGSSCQLKFVHVPHSGAKVNNYCLIPKYRAKLKIVVTDEQYCCSVNDEEMSLMRPDTLMDNA
jgi:hypothetical protein